MLVLVFVGEIEFKVVARNYFVASGGGFRDGWDGVVVAVADIEAFYLDSKGRDDGVVVAVADSETEKFFVRQRTLSIGWKGSLLIERRYTW